MRTAQLLRQSHALFFCLISPTMAPADVRAEPQPLFPAGCSADKSGLQDAPAPPAQRNLRWPRWLAMLSLLPGRIPILHCPIRQTSGGTGLRVPSFLPNIYLPCIEKKCYSVHVSDRSLGISIPRSPHPEAHPENQGMGVQGSGATVPLTWFLLPESRLTWYL